MAIRPLDHDLHGRRMRQGGFVGPAGAQRIVHVCDGYDASSQRNVIASETIRIAGAVVALMVMTRDVNGHLQEDRCEGVLVSNFLQSGCPDRGVRLHKNAFICTQLARLQQDMVG